MKKNKWILGAGIGTLALAACAVVKGVLDKHKGEGLNDQEVPSIEAGDETEDRGVAPVEDGSAQNDDEVKNLKADAINHGYQPIKY